MLRRGPGVGDIKSRSNSVREQHKKLKEHVDQFRKDHNIDEFGDIDAHPKLKYEFDESTTSLNQYLLEHYVPSSAPINPDDENPDAVERRRTSKAELDEKIEQRKSRYRSNISDGMDIEPEPKKEEVTPKRKYVIHIAEVVNLYVH